MSEDLPLMADSLRDSLRDVQVNELTKRYYAAMRKSGLPYRMPTRRLAEQLAATGEAAALAQALALLVGGEWENRAVERARDLRTRVQMGQSDVDSAERAESKLRRYGLHHLR